MINIWAIVGPANARHSSTVRALTGIGNGARVIQIHYAAPNGGTPQTIPTYVRHSSAQDEELSPQALCNQISASRTSRSIIILRHLHKKTGYHAHHYFDQIIKVNNWNIVGYANLGLSAAIAGNQIPIPTHFPNARAEPANLIASKLRTAWGIV